MAISRVQKFKNYRNSLIKEETPVLETPKSSPKSEYTASEKQTTSTLPMDQVIKSLNEEDTEAVFSKKRKRDRLIMILVLSGVGALLIAGIIVFAILVWR